MRQVWIARQDWTTGGVSITNARKRREKTRKADGAGNWLAGQFLRSFVKADVSGAVGALDQQPSSLLDLASMKAGSDVVRALVNQSNLSTRRSTVHGASRRGISAHRLDHYAYAVLAARGAFLPAAIARVMTEDTRVSSGAPALHGRREHRAGTAIPAGMR